MKLNPFTMFAALAMSAFTLPAAIAALADTTPAKTSEAIPWSEIGAKAGADYKGDGLAVMPYACGARLHCVFQRLEGEATREGLWLTSTAEESKGERFRVVARAVGRHREVLECGSPLPLLAAPRQWESGRGLPQSKTLARAPQPSEFTEDMLPPTGLVFIDGKVARFTRPGLVEEYTVSMDGVRQDFLITRRPEGTGEMQVELDVAGAWVQPTAHGAELVLARSGRKIAYSRLRVTDATGKELTARMEVLETKSESKNQKAKIRKQKLHWW